MPSAATSARRLCPLLWALLVALPTLVSAQVTTSGLEQEVYVYQIDPFAGATVEDCYLPKYERNKIKLTIDLNSPFFDVNTSQAGQEVVEDVGCFMPTHKLVYEEFTYLVSTYCASSRKFANSAPYVTSARQLPSDLIFTDVLQAELERIHTVNFKPGFKEIYAQLAKQGPKTVRKAINLGQVYDRLQQDRDVAGALEGQDNQDDAGDAQAENEARSADAGENAEGDDDPLEGTEGGDPDDDEKPKP